MKYNTQQKKLPIPEYGRSVQNMVDYCCTIEDKEERQQCANTIITVMGNMFPQSRDLPDFKHKLWDQLAIMSDFKLDVDFPYEIVRPDNLTTKPEPISYPQNNIKYRHYGHIVVDLIKKACEMTEGEERDNLVALICNHMRKNYVLWNKDMVDDQKIAQDLDAYSNGKLMMTDNVLHLMQVRYATYGKPVAERSNSNNNNNNNKNKKNKRNNYKKQS
jgi:hypothetical protein